MVPPGGVLAVGTQAQTVSFDFSEGGGAGGMTEMLMKASERVKECVCMCGKGWRRLQEWGWRQAWDAWDAWQAVCCARPLPQPAHGRCLLHRRRP